MSDSDSRPRRHRQLSADEHRLWGHVTRLIKPLRSGRLRTPVPGSDEPANEPPGETRAPQPSVRSRSAPQPEGQPPLAPLERRLRQRLAKGHVPIDHRLDLHGLTQREAHDALIHFLRAAQAHGARIVLVVTGKGRRQADADPFAERGALRRLVPHWLHGAELRNLVVGFETAHIGHGGEGALYVRLRRQRGSA